jgi:hypothetical protein
MFDVLESTLETESEVLSPALAFCIAWAARSIDWVVEKENYCYAYQREIFACDDPR